MSVTVGELVGFIRADDGDFIDALDRSDNRMRRFQVETDGTLREVEHDFGTRGRAMGEALRHGIDETLAELHPEVPVGADPRPADIAVARLVHRLEGLQARIGVDVSEEEAVGELDAIRAELRLLSQAHADPEVRVLGENALFTLGLVRSTIDDVDRAHPRVQVDVDAARALAELHEVDRQERGIGDNDGPRRAGGMFGMLGAAVAGVLGPLGAATGQAGLMAGAIGAAIPVAAALVATLVNIAPAAAIGASAVLALASAAGAVKLGTAGIGGALKAVFAPPAGGGGGGAAKAANQTASALRAVKDAARQAAYANQAAARQVSDAERNVADAQKAARTAQLDLNAAREQATRDLQDLNDQLTDARLSERGAAADVTTALDALNAARAQGMGQGTSMDALQLSYDQAVQKLKEAKEQTSRLSEDTTKANTAGVNGSKTMVDARQKVFDSNRALSDQERALSDARVQQSRTAAAGLESVQKAEEALAAAGAKAAGGGGGVNALATALAKLSPNARAFVMQVIALKGAWMSMQQAVQNSLFEGMASSLKATSTAVLPVLRTGLVSTAGALNLMARGAMDAAARVASNGTLGQAMASANAGLHNLAGVPALVIRSFVQLAAAAGPAFQALTAAAGRGAAGIGAKLNAAFTSGRMKAAIDTAVGLIKQIGIIGGNVFHIIGSIFGAANSTGGGFLNTLQRITGELAKAFASPAVQAGLRAMFGLFGQVSRLLAGALGPLLTQIAGAVGQLAPVISNVLSSLGDAGPVVALVLAQFSPFLAIMSLLGPVLGQLAKPIGLLIQGLAPLIAAVGVFAGQLGKALVPVVTALAPVLASIGGAFGNLLVAVSPLLQLLGTLIGAALKPLGPIFKTIGGVIAQLAPVVSLLAVGLGRALTPVLTSLGTVLGTIVSQAAAQFVLILRQLLPLVPVMIPVLVQMGQSLGQILLAVAPLIPQLGMLSAQLATQLLPAILPLIPVWARMEILLLRLATGAITHVVVPALSLLVRTAVSMAAGLKPVFDSVTWVTTHIVSAFRWLYDVLVGHSIIPDLIREIVWWFAGLPRKAWNALSSLAGNLAGRARDAGVSMVDAIRTQVSNAVSWVRGLPGRARSALGDLSGVLYNAGRALLHGFIDGIKSMTGAAGNAASTVLSFVKDHFPNSPAKRGPFSGRGWTMYSGIAVASDFAAGLRQQHGYVGGTARALMAAAHTELGAPGTAGAALVTPPGAAYARGAAGGSGGSSGGGERVLRLIVDGARGQDELTKVFRKIVSVGGGDVQGVLGTGG